MAPKTSKNKSKGSKKEVEVKARKYRSRQLEITLAMPECPLYPLLLELVRDSVTYKVVGVYRVTSPEPSNGMYKFVDISLKNGPYGITMRVTCHDVYLMAVKRHSKKGKWYCVDKKFVKYIEGGLSADTGENYSNLGRLENATIGYGAFKKTIKAIDTSEILNTEENKMHLLNLIVNVLEASRFGVLGRDITEHFENGRTMTLPSEWPDEIRNWGDKGFEAIKGLKLSNMDNIPIHNDGNEWYNDDAMKITLNCTRVTPTPENIVLVAHSVATAAIASHNKDEREKVLKEREEKKNSER